MNGPTKLLHPATSYQAEVEDLERSSARREQARQGFADGEPVPERDVEAEHFDLVDRIVAFETGQLDEDETIGLFQHLVDTGAAWTLQGTYGRTAVALLEAGLLRGPIRAGQ